MWAFNPELEILIFEMNHINPINKYRKEHAMQKGTVKFFDETRGYGFLTSEGKDVFVHYSGISGTGRKTLKQGANVQFSVIDGPKGKQAVEVSEV